jgi:hypothetical protein
MNQRTRRDPFDDAVRVNLPHSEVCIHLKVAGRDHWAAKIDERCAQIYLDDGEPYSTPILLSEAGLDRYGHPRRLHEPTCTALHIWYRDAAGAKNSVRVVLADPWDEHTFRAQIAPQLEEGAFFTPCQVGLPDAHFEKFTIHDHPSHTFWRGPQDSQHLEHVFEIVSEQPTLKLTWAQLCARFSAITSFDPANWPGAGTIAEPPL